MRRNFIELLILTLSLMSLSPAQAVPTIISTIPPNLASGVSPSAAVVFTFSEAMDTSLTEVTFQSFIPPFTLVDHPTTTVWSGGNTVLTCTPSPAFPANTQIIWIASGENLVGDPLGEPTGGAFTTGTGSGGGTGSGTNAITTFSVGKVHHYNQTSSGSPTLDPTAPYNFSGVTALSSNRTATSVTLTLPTGAVSNLTQLPPPQSEIYIMPYSFSTSLSTYDTTFPAGNYSFFVQAAASNQTVVVNLPTTNSMPQPGAPHLTNYPAAQTVNPSQAFVLGWDAFPGGTAADYVYVEIGTAYSSPNPGKPGALPGTARTFTIPAGTLQPNSTYDSTIGFYRPLSATNASYATTAYRATFTDFSLITTSGAVTGPLVLTNASWSAGVFSFDVLCSPGQTVTVEYTNLLASASGPWPKLLTTNSPGTRVHIVSPPAGTSPSHFYRARNGP